MRKLREAALVAVMIGSAGVLGAGAVTAHENPTIVCDQQADRDNASLEQGGTVAVAGPGGDAVAAATPQNCGLGNEDNTNEAGSAAGGVGTGVAE